MQAAEQLKPLMADVGYALHKAHLAGDNLLFEGAQGTCWTSTTAPTRSSRPATAWPAMPPPDRARAQHAALRAGHHQGLHHPGRRRTVPDRAGHPRAGAVGHHLSTVGQERGVVTGRMRRCGWLDAAALKRSMIINGISGLCITKLDVLDGLPEIRVCTGYRLGGRELDILPLDADEIAQCEPVYETLPGWSESTAGLTNWEQLPTNARRYLERMQALIGVPIDMVSTGPDRVHTILLRHPYPRLTLPPNLQRRPRRPCSPTTASTCTYPGTSTTCSSSAWR
jgi:adenylosuccinate synthase